MCGKTDETLDHLFFECDFSQAVWIDVMRWCGIMRMSGKWSTERDFLISQCTNNNGRQRLYRCAMAILVYGLWQERNQ